MLETVSVVVVSDRDIFNSTLVRTDGPLENAAYKLAKVAELRFAKLNLDKLEKMESPIPAV